MVVVENLNISFPVKNRIEDVVKGISFCINNEKLAIIGGSGSGKTLTAKSLFGLVPKPGLVNAAKLSVFGNNLLKMNQAELRKIRGNVVSMIMQDPKFSLNPVLTVGKQIDECFKWHHGMDNKQAKQSTLDILLEVNIKDPKNVYKLYPYQLSGGMGQVVMIAMMVACGPKLLIADEATSALDKESKQWVLKLLNVLCKTRQMSLLMISHDLLLILECCDRVLVMNSGIIVDHCKTSELRLSKNPYTQSLCDSIFLVGKHYDKN